MKFDKKWVTIKISNLLIRNISNKVTSRILLHLSNKYNEQLEKVLDLNLIHLEENAEVYQENQIPMIHKTTIFNSEKVELELQCEIQTAILLLLDKLTNFTIKVWS